MDVTKDIWTMQEEDRIKVVLCGFLPFLRGEGDDVHNQALELAFRLVWRDSIPRSDRWTKVRPTV